MVSNFDESRFHALWRSADEALQLEARARDVLARRHVSTFDGLGHLLDHVFPDDPSRLAHLAEVLRLPPSALERLRASELDPLQMPREALALLGRMTGLDFAAFIELAKRDHARFAMHSDDLVARGQAESAGQAEAVDELAATWRRLADDSATDL